MPIEGSVSKYPWANPFENPESNLVRDYLKDFGHINVSLGTSEHQDAPWINIDIRKLENVQMVHDLELLPWPLPDSCADVIVAALIAEHINPAKFGIFKFFDECWRVLKPGKCLMLSVPNAGGPMHWGDPSHTVGFTVDTFTHFDPLHNSGRYFDYQPLPWKLDPQKCFMQALGIIEIVLEKRVVDDSYGVKSYA